MKIALIHDYIKEYGGAEKVLEALHDIFPDAPIYTTVYCSKFLGPHRERFRNFKIQTSFLQFIPFKEKFISVFRVVSPFVFKSFDLSRFDVIIVSQTGAYFPNLIHKTKNQKLITYTHTPPRYLYGYKTAREWKNNKLFLILGEIANHFLRLVDFKAAQNVDQFIANSEEVKARIKKFYRKEAVVVFPPAADISNIKNKQSLGSIDPQISKTQIKDQKEKKEYYLTGGRLARAKGIDVIIEAFSKLNKPLKIFGKGFAGYEEDLKSLIINHKSLIEFLGEVSDEEKFELMKNAKAFIFASFDEDFGITPVEAMSVGTPVIAYKSGGVKETVINPSTGSGQAATGLFYDENTKDELIKAIKRFETLQFDPKDCIKQAEKFSEEEFKRKIKKIIDHKS